MECETILNIYRCYGPCPFLTRQWYKSEVGGAIYARQTTIEHHRRAEGTYSIPQTIHFLTY